MPEGPKLYALDIGTVVVRIKGITPLICNRFSEDVEEQIANKQKGGAQRGKKPRDPEDEWARALYSVNGTGTFGFPAIGFKKAMVRAAKNVGMAMTDARGAFHVIGDVLPLIDQNEWEGRTDRVVHHGVTSIAYRPMFRDWEIDVPVRYNARMITPEQIINLLEEAGFSVGIGAWRPECNGTYGMFEVKRDE